MLNFNSISKMFRNLAPTWSLDMFKLVCIHYVYFFRVIRYEDFCLDIKTNAASLLEFFSFKMHMRVAKFINSHTHENIGGVSSTFRDSKNAPYHWRNELSFAEVQNIQEKCSEALKLWGYKKADTSDELENLQPLLEYHLW